MWEPLFKYGEILNYSDFLSGPGGPPVYGVN